MLNAPRGQGIAEVHRPDTNCGASTQGLRELPSWLAEASATAEADDPVWDCVHLNCELRNLAALLRGLLGCCTVARKQRSCHVLSGSKSRNRTLRP